VRIVTLTYAGATDGRELLIDRDCILRLATSPSSGVLVSTDPQLKYVDLGSSAVDGIDYSVLTIGGDQLNFQLNRGDRIYCSVSSQGSLMLGFEDLS
jgi:hypothetical protein